MTISFEQVSQFLTTFIQNMVTGSSTQLIVNAVVFVLFFVMFRRYTNKWRIQTKQRAGKKQITREILIGLLSAVVGTATSTFIYWSIDNGYSEIYLDVDKYGWGYLVFIVIAMWIFDDAWFYWCHRLMHNKRVYKYVHALHHESLDVNPFTSLSFHPIEALMLSFWILPASLFVPIPAAGLGVLQMIGLYNNIKSHLGYEIYPKWFMRTPLKYLVSSTHHNVHHTQYNGNYGLHFRFWDLICGTEFDGLEEKQIEIRSRKDAKIIDNTRYQPLTIAKLVHETNETVSVYLDAKNPEFYNYQAGQYMNIEVKVNGKKLKRVFSLSSAPTDKYLRLTMKLNGAVTHHFFNDAKVGDTVNALLPVGDFVLNESHTGHYLIVAGGSGITPLFSMIKTLLHNKPDAKITLLYANRNKDTKIFAKELDTLDKQHAGFKVVDFYSNKSRISKQDIQDILTKYPNSQTYICGPESLKTTIRQYIKELDTHKNRIHSEDFVDSYLPWFGLAR